MITRKLKHVSYVIDNDPDPWDPRSDGDNLTTIALTNNRYLSGDKILDPDLLRQIHKDPDIEYKNIYAYIHSGILLSFSPFSCPWDSGQIGFIYTDKKTIQKEFNKLHWKKTAKQVIEAEFNSFKLYVEGDNYLVSIKDNYTGEILDCISYCDAIDYVKIEAEALAKYHDSRKAETYNRLVTEVC